jgi:futalosine hydrolase
LTVLVVTAVVAERDAALRDLGPASPADLPYGAVRAGDVVVAAGGVGPVAAAVATSRLLTLAPFHLVISAGIAGGFAGRATIGDVVAAGTSVFADLGAATADGFLGLSGLGLTGGAPLTSPVAVPPELKAQVGTILTLATMTGTDVRGTALADAHPDALAEAMEGYGVAWAATEHGVPWLELRAVSNLIGRRDRSGWDIPTAFDALGRAVRLVTSP